MDLSICCIKECDRPSVALGLCVNHWRRNRKYGSPIALKHHSGTLRGVPPREKFERRILKTANGCWEWAGSRDVDGYGVFMAELDGVLYKRAHRFSFAMHKHAPPSRVPVCHSCDNPPCVNPDHLWLGTNLENQRDKWAKGRGRGGGGQKNAHAILTPEQVAEILRDARTYAELAHVYGVSASTIGSIKQRLTWRDVPGESVKVKRIGPRRGVSEKITPAIVKEIRASGATLKELAAQHGVSPQTICDIRKRRSWSHIE